MNGHRHQALVANMRARSRTASWTRQATTHIPRTPRNNTSAIVSNSVSSRGNIWRYWWILDGLSRVISTCKTAILSGVWSSELAHS
jgi:hypothetical protein